MPAIARDVQLGDLVLASNGIKKRKYVCLCPDAHAVCLKQGTERAVHFAHIPVRGPDGDFIPSCRSGGESEEHIKAKLKLVEQRGDYSFCLKTCKVCKKKVMEDCRNGTMKIEAWSGDKRWKYDVLYTRSDGSKLALEVYHTHATGENKVLSSTAAGIPIAEFDAGDILRMKEGTILDNKLDTSWVCSAMCRGLKQQRDRLLEMTARQRERKRMRQAEEARRYLQQCEAIKQRKLAKEQEAIRVALAAKVKPPVKTIDQQQAPPKRPCTIVDNTGGLGACPIMHNYQYVPWNSPYAIVNNGRALSYGHPPKPELTLSNHPPPPFDTKFDYTVPIMGQPSDHKNKKSL
jgi:hypothetical protein